VTRSLLHTRPISFLLFKRERGVSVHLPGGESFQGFDSTRLGAVLLGTSAPPSMVSQTASIKPRGEISFDWVSGLSPVRFRSFWVN
jgi:hypothetical protein